MSFIPAGVSREDRSGSVRALMSMSVDGFREYCEELQKRKEEFRDRRGPGLFGELVKKAFEKK